MRNSGWGDGWQQHEVGTRRSRRWPLTQLTALIVVVTALVGYGATTIAFLVTRRTNLAAVASSFLTLNDVGLFICGVSTCIIALRYDRVPGRKLPRWMIALLGSVALAAGVIGVANSLHWLGCNI
jgi:uncharacterized BrkB/YihY/UPF0761 family membrane protein